MHKRKDQRSNIRTVIETRQNDTPTVNQKLQ